MLVLVEAFFFTDDYWSRVDLGIISQDDDFEYTKDCELRNILVNLNTIASVKPMEDSKYTCIETNTTSFVINIPFKDFLQLVPYQTAKHLIKKWAN